MTVYDFDFEEWANLYKENETAYELKRKEYIQQHIDTIPEPYRERMIKLQWRLDMQRKLARTPIESCINMYEQMWDSMLGPNSLMSKLELLTGSLLNSEYYRAEVDEFRKKALKDNVTPFRKREVEAG